MPLPPSRLRSSARSRLFCCRVVSGDSEPPVEGPMLPVVPVAPSPGCGEPSSAPVRARGIVLPAATSFVDGEIEPGGAAAELGAGPEPDVPDAEPAAPAAPEDAPPDDPPLDCARAAAPKASDAASARGMMVVRDMWASSGGNARTGRRFGSQHHVD